MIALYLDYVNNYITVKAFAAAHDLTYDEALESIVIGKACFLALLARKPILMDC